MQIGLSLKTTCAVIFSPLLLQGEEFFLSVRAYSRRLDYVRLNCGDEFRRSRAASWGCDPGEVRRGRDSTARLPTRGRSHPASGNPVHCSRPAAGPAAIVDDDLLAETA